MFCNIKTKEMKRNISIVNIWKNDTKIILMNARGLFNAPLQAKNQINASLYLTPRVLKRAFIRTLDVDTKVGLEIKYAVMFLSYFLIYIKNTRDIFYTSLFYDVLVYFCFFDSSCSSSIFVILRLSKSLKVMSENPVKKGL